MHAEITYVLSDFPLASSNRFLYCNFMRCPHCKKTIDDGELARYLASKGGSRTSPRKAETARANLRKPRFLVCSVNGAEITRHHVYARAQLAARRYERRAGRPAT